MPVTQIPSRDPLPPSAGTPPEQPEHRELNEAQHWESAYRKFNPEDVPHLLIQLQDDLSRARKREALWLSVVLHLLVVILLWNTDKLVALWPQRTVPLEVRTDNQDKNATFLELPPDEQKLTKRPDAKIASDKDRIATSKAPQINREELKKLLESTRPGRLGSSGPAQPTPPPPPQQSAQTQPPQQAPQQNLDPNSGFIPPRTSDQSAQLRTPPQGSNRPVPSFKTPLTPGSAIEQAEQAAAANRGRYGGGGNLGDGGLSRGQGGPKALDQAEILTDTLGVDFGPYITRILQVVKANWYNSMPESVYPPILKQGKLAIDFLILPNGKVASMVLRTSSGDVPLDRAAWASITASNPLPALPRDFIAQCAQPISDEKCNFGLRLYYFYNLEVDKELK